MKGIGCVLLLAGALFAVICREGEQKKSFRQIKALERLCGWATEQIERYQVPLGSLMHFCPADLQRECLGRASSSVGKRIDCFPRFLEGCQASDPDIARWLLSFSRALEAPAGSRAPREIIKEYRKEIREKEASAATWQKNGRHLWETLCFGAAGAVMILLW